MRGDVSSRLKHQWLMSGLSLSPEETMKGASFSTTHRTHTQKQKEPVVFTGRVSHIQCDVELSGFKNIKHSVARVPKPHGYLKSD